MMDKKDKRYSYLTVELRIKKRFFYNFYKFFRAFILPNFLESHVDAVNIDVLEYVEE